MVLALVSMIDSMTAFHSPFITATEIIFSSPDHELLDLWQTVAAA
jgi:hypothetical protein